MMNGGRTFTHSDLGLQHHHQVMLHHHPGLSKGSHLLLSDASMAAQRITLSHTLITKLANNHGHHHHHHHFMPCPGVIPPEQRCQEAGPWAAGSSSAASPPLRGAASSPAERSRRKGLRRTRTAGFRCCSETDGCVSERKSHKRVQRQGNSTLRVHCRCATARRSYAQLDRKSSGRHPYLSPSIPTASLWDPGRGDGWMTEKKVSSLRL